MTGVSRFCKIILRSCYKVPVRIYSIKIPLNLLQYWYAREDPVLYRSSSIESLKYRLTPHQIYTYSSLICLRVVFIILRVFMNMVYEIFSKVFSAQILNWCRMLKCKLFQKFLRTVFLKIQALFTRHSHL